MKILAIDSSGIVATVAVLEDDELTAEYTVNYKKTHSETLLPMIDEIKKMTDLDLSTIDAIAVAKGPGSFTGLRIGSATAKGLAAALNIPIIPVPTVDALSMNMWGVSGLICPIMDARRNQVYTGLYKFEKAEEKLIEKASADCEDSKSAADNKVADVTCSGYNHVVIEPQTAMSIEELCEKINSIFDNEAMDGDAMAENTPLVTFLGDGVPVFKDYIDEHLGVEHLYAPAGMNRQRACSLGILAKEYYKKGITETADEHKPEYLRLSQAERERAEKESTDN